MSTIQRLALLAAAAAVIVLAVIVIGPGDDAEDTTTTAASLPTAQTATTTATTTAAPAAPTLLKAGSVKTLTVTKGDTVRFRVVHPTAEEVHVHGYDFKFDLEPGVTKTISFPARIEGQFEIELEQSGTPLAKLVVNPR